MIKLSSLQKKISIYIGLCLLSLIIIFTLVSLYKKGRHIAITHLSYLLQKEIKKQNLNIKWETMNLSLVPLKVHWKKVSVNIPSSVFPTPFVADSLSIKPDYMALLKRNLLVRAKAENLSAQVKIPNPIFSPKNKKTKLTFSFPSNLPVSQVQLKNADLLLISNQNHTLIKQANILLNGHPSKITMTSHIGSIKTSDRPAFSSTLNITITPTKVSVPLFLLKSPHSNLKLSGRIKGNLMPFKLNEGQIKADGDFVMDDLSALLKIASPSFKQPFKGRANLKTQVHYNSSEQWKGYIEFKASKLWVNQVFLSQANLKAKLKKQTIFIEHFQMGENKNWQIALKEGQINTKNPFAFQTQVFVNQAKLSHLFSDMSLKKMPLYGHFNGLGKCWGQNLFHWSFMKIECEGQSQLKNFKVKQKKEDPIIIAPFLKITKQIAFKNHKAKIKAHINGPDSSLAMKGVVSQQNGFLADFEGRFNLNDLEDLVSLKPKGIAYLNKGSLSVVKDKVTLQANLKTKDLMLDGFHIGSAKTQVDWTEEQILHFRKIKGRFKKSQYKGNISVNIPNNSIRVFAHSPFISLSDLKSALKNHIYFPFSLKGKGHFSGYLQGPLQANILSYNLSAQFFDIAWEGESFDKGLLKIESQNGYVKTKQAILTKGLGQVIFEGAVDPKGNLKARLKGEKLALQNSENISQALGHDIEGDMAFDMLLSDYFLKPFNHTKIHIQNSFFKGYPLKDSHLNLNISQKAVSASGSLAGKINLHKVIFPFKKTGDVKLKADVKGLNIKELFFSKSDSSSLYNQFQSNIDGSLDLAYKKQHLTRSLTGFIKVDKLSLSPPTGQLNNQGPFFLALQEGVMKLNPFSLKSSNHSLHFRQDQKIYITGDLKLDFLIFLFPFMKSWEGDLNINLNLEPKLFAPALEGELALQKGFIQLNDHIDPFEESTLQADIKNRHINVPSLYTKLGGGEIKGQGSLFWSLKKKLHVDVKAGFKNVIFSSLPGLFARGEGQLSLKGKSFPYTLGVKANLQDLKVEKEFNTSSVASIQLNQRFLALKETQKTTEPLNLNLSLFPKNPIQIENSVMKADFIGNIKVVGPPENPLLTGTLRALPEGIIRFREHDFRLRSAQIHYANSSPSNPTIDLRANSSVREDPSARSDRETEIDNFSNEYQVSLSVKGLGQNPRFRLSATPPLSEKEIVSLLAFGARSIKFDAKNPLNNIIRYSYSHLGSALFQKAIGRELKNTLDLQPLLIPHINSKTGATTPKLVVRKTMFNRLTLSSSHTLLDEERESDIKAKYKINKNVSLIGLWKNESLEEGRDEESNTLGLNLEYQIDF